MTRYVVFDSDFDKIGFFETKLDSSDFLSKFATFMSRVNPFSDGVYYFENINYFCIFNNTSRRYKSSSFEFTCIDDIGGE